MNKEQNRLFNPRWWLSNPHIQSCYCRFIHHKASVKVEWEQLELPDGDFIDVCWAGSSTAPLVLLLHGLEGSVNSHYIQLMLDVLTRRGFAVGALHFRACSGRLNRLPRYYHAGDTADLSYLIQLLEFRYPTRPLYLIGFSLGGNVTLHYLSQNTRAPIQRAIVVSVPFELYKSVAQLPTIYEWQFIRSMKQKVMEKIKAGYRMPVTPDDLKKINSFVTFDDAITAPLHGFSDSSDYYKRASTRYQLRKIQHQTLIIQAHDDPLVPTDSIPRHIDLPSNVKLEMNPKGGHVGFIIGGSPWHPESWLERRIVDFLPSPLNGN